MNAISFTDNIELRLLQLRPRTAHLSRVELRSTWAVPPTARSVDTVADIVVIFYVGVQVFACTCMTRRYALEPARQTTTYAHWYIRCAGGTGERLVPTPRKPAVQS